MEGVGVRVSKVTNLASTPTIWPFDDRKGCGGERKGQREHNAYGCHGSPNINCNPIFSHENVMALMTPYGRRISIHGNLQKIFVTAIVFSIETMSSASMLQHDIATLTYATEDVEVVLIVTPPFSHCFVKVEGPR